MVQTKDFCLAQLDLLLFPLLELSQFKHSAKALNLNILEVRGIFVHFGNESTIFDLLKLLNLLLLSKTFLLHLLLHFKIF